MFQKAFRGPGCFVVPEVFKFIFKHPGAVYAPIAFIKGIEDLGIFWATFDPLFRKDFYEILIIQ